MNGFFLLFLITAVIHSWLADLQQVLWLDSPEVNWPFRRRCVCFFFLFFLLSLLPPKFTSRRFLTSTLYITLQLIDKFLEECGIELGTSFGRDSWRHTISIHPIFLYRFCDCSCRKISDEKRSRLTAKSICNGIHVDETPCIREWSHYIDINVCKSTIRSLEIILWCFGVFANFMFLTLKTMLYHSIYSNWYVGSHKVITYQLCCCTSFRMWESTKVYIRSEITFYQIT